MADQPTRQENRSATSTAAGILGQMAKVLQGGQPPHMLTCRCGQVWMVADEEVGPHTRCVACPACGADDLYLVSVVEGGAR